ncbi:hypothetical protein [Ferroglobus sp.]|uniref:hypothetical protein n=1 Tax=Ferroglobus sp. TaxID=2614230 RepID=UPI0025C53D03|nr:hypothetical protein [Ferroglobus sp.]
MEFEYKGRKVKVQTLEKGKDYSTMVVHFELPNSEHHGFLLKVGDKIVAKGEIAKAVRDAKINGVEMAVAPPADTNALIMLRISGEEREILEKVLEIVESFLKERGLI